MCLVETTLTLIGDNSYLFLFAFSLDIFIVRIFRASEQGDESGCTMVVIQITGGEGCQRFAVQAVWGSGFGFDDVPFIEFEFDFAGYVLLCRLYKCLDSFTKRSEPFFLVYYLSQVIAYFLLVFTSMAARSRINSSSCACVAIRNGSASYKFSANF